MRPSAASRRLRPSSSACTSGTLWHKRSHTTASPERALVSGSTAAPRAPAPPPTASPPPTELSGGPTRAPARRATSPSRPVPPVTEPPSARCTLHAGRRLLGVVHEREGLLELLARQHRDALGAVDLEVRPLEDELVLAAGNFVVRERGVLVGVLTVDPHLGPGPRPDGDRAFGGPGVAARLRRLFCVVARCGDGGLAHLLLSRRRAAARRTRGPGARRR